MQLRIGIGSVVAALLVVFWSQAGLAQGNCGNIQFSTDISSRFPNARAACLGVVQRDGRDFAHFSARIRQVRGNTVEAEFKLPDGTYGRPVTFEASPDARAKIQGTDLPHPRAEPRPGARCLSAARPMGDRGG